eukprot:2773460-Ditylum_brightwellii.AAC.1
MTGEYKTDLKKYHMGIVAGTAKYVHMLLSPLDLEIISSFEDERFMNPGIGLGLAICLLSLLLFGWPAAEHQV